MSKGREIKEVEEVVAKIASVVDFVILLTRALSEHINRVCANLEALPEVFTTLGVADVVSDVMNSMRASGDLITKLMPSSKMCGEEKYREFWSMHSALLFYHYDALMLIRHSMLSAFTGYYSVAFTELRSAMESIVRGIIFDLLAIPEYRKRSKELQKIKGFMKGRSFSELIELLKTKVGNERLKASIEIFDLIDKELKNFNPEAAFTKLLVQLREWSIVDDEMLEDMNSYYAELSKRAHRVHPKFSEVGIRAVTQRDWLELEPVPEELFTYLHNFVELNGMFTYLVLKVFSVDLMQDNFMSCVNWRELEQTNQLVSELAKKYKYWSKVLQLLKQLRAS